ncbi:alpha/beta fold hydrolase [Leptolyngbya sp. FACHB-261]|uniref:alpha/beta fold hydrolase n=1 Tax=Leptolyngbya sp. FACHB-261 TaxID=2692806 RepID=UPI00168814AC|nr:alpha/beta hydrolase [Leptolyngbya sp. FACHB-261]MBD2103276.1 alpha/beta hydrolase [Leptolyngbya sp. FACHB-261]
MLFMPLNFLLMWPLGLLSIALLGSGVYILYEWYEGELNSTLYLVIGLVLVLWSLAGHLPLLLLLRRPGVDEPKPTRNGTVQMLKRPDGSKIRVEFYGPAEGPVLILTHGWGPNSTIWYYVKKQLGEHFRLVVWDLPGLGKSSKPKNQDYSIEKYARDLEAVVALVKDRPVTLLGHSIGGMIVLTFCRLFPDQLGQQVAGLVLVDTTYTNPVKTAILSRFLRAVQQPLLKPLLYLTIGLWPLVWLMNWLNYLNGTLHLSMWLSGFRGTETRGQLNFSTLLSLHGSPAVLARGTLAMLDYEAMATLPKIQIPVLIIVGDSDIVTVPAASKRMSAELAEAELVILKQAGHMGLMEHNQRFSEIVGQFSASCSNPPHSY